MSIKVIEADRVTSLLPVRECIDVMAEAMAAASGGKLAAPPRMFLALDDAGRQFGVMPAASGELEYYGAKIVSITPGNSAQGLPTIRGGYLLFEKETGAPVALIDSAALTAIRTAAASGLATRLLARTNARTCGIFGTGVQAVSHVEAMCAVRPFEEVRIWGRNFAKAKALAEELARGTNRRVAAFEDPTAVGACDVLCTVTAAKAPILRGAWVRPGAHVNLVGSHTLTAREADSSLIVRAKVYVDLIESARNEAGDLMMPIEEGSVLADHVRGEIGQVVAGRLAGRASAEEITLYKSLGVAAQDLYAASHVYKRSTPDFGPAGL